MGDGRWGGGAEGVSTSLVCGATTREGGGRGAQLLDNNPTRNTTTHVRLDEIDALQSYRHENGTGTPLCPAELKFTRARTEDEVCLLTDHVSQFSLLVCSQVEHLNFHSPTIKSTCLTVLRFKFKHPPAHIQHALHRHERVYGPTA